VSSWWFPDLGGLEDLQGVKKVFLVGNAEDLEALAGWGEAEKPQDLSVEDDRSAQGGSRPTSPWQAPVGASTT